MTIESSDQNSFDEEDDKIMSLKKIEMKKKIERALPIVGDLSLEMRQSSRLVN